MSWSSERSECLELCPEHWKYYINFTLNIIVPQGDKVIERLTQTCHTICLTSHQSYVQPSWSTAISNQQMKNLWSGCTRGILRGLQLEKGRAGTITQIFQCFPCSSINAVSRLRIPFPLPRPAFPQSGDCNRLEQETQTGDWTSTGPADQAGQAEPSPLARLQLGTEPRAS